MRFGAVVKEKGDPDAMFSIVIVDDEKLICDAIRSVLETSVPDISRITVFYDGQDAYDYLLQNRADILLLDIEVPGKTGFELAQLVRSRYADCFILMITAYREFEYAQQAIHYSVDDFLTKPFASSQLIAAVQKAIDGFRKASSLQEERRKAERSLLLSLCRSSTMPRGCGDIRFCRKEIPLRELTCTEITLTGFSKDSVPAQQLPTAEEMFIRTAEHDSDEQTSLLIEQTQDLIRVLVLSRSEPDLSFLSGLTGAVAAQTGSTPTCTRKTYASFADYRTWLSFEQEMDVFFDLLSDNSAAHAKKHLSRFARTLKAAQLQMFAEFLLRDYGLETEPEPEAILRAADQLIQRQLSGDTGNLIVESAKRYIQQNFAQSSLSLESVAQSLYITSAYLSRLFKKHTGLNFSDWLLRKRMEYAQELLRTTNLPTTAVAAAVGYNNISYFRLSFKGYFGMTPSQYRQSQNGGKDGVSS